MKILKYLLACSKYAYNIIVFRGLVFIMTKRVRPAMPYTQGRVKLFGAQGANLI